MERAFIEVVIPAFNGEDLIVDCLASVTNVLSGVPIIVVDDCSEDNTAKLIVEQFPSVNIVSNQNNIGFGQSCNVGAFSTTSEWVLLLNQDAILKSFDLEKVRAIAMRPEVAVIGGRTEYHDGRLLPNIGLEPSLPRLFFLWPTLPLRFIGIEVGGQYLTSYPKYEESADVTWITGSCLLVRREIFEEQGGFDSSYFIYAEEVEHALRSRDDGYSVVYEPGIVSMHENRAGGGMSAFSVFHALRGHRLLIKSRFGRFQSIIYMLTSCISCIFFGLLSTLLLWWSPKRRFSSIGMLKGGIRALFRGWSSFPEP